MTITKKVPMSPESIDICLLYDPSNGHIAHVHRVAAFAGARKSSKEEVEARCLTVAKQLGHPTTHMKTLHVSSGELKPFVLYKVDVESRKLIEQPTAGRIPLKPKTA